MPKSRDALGWDHDTERPQLVVQVSNWQYKLFVDSFNSHRTNFQFLGAVESMWSPASLVGIGVSGNIEVPLEVQYPDEENSAPEHMGTFYLSKEHYLSDPDFVVTLLTAPDVYTELVRMFSTAFDSNAGLGLSLNINLMHPNGAERNFWRTAWREEEILVSHFGFFTGGEYPKSKRG